MNTYLLIANLYLKVNLGLLEPSVQFSSAAQSCPTLCDPMNGSTPGLPVHHQLPEYPLTDFYLSFPPVCSKRYQWNKQAENVWPQKSARRAFFRAGLYKPLKLWYDTIEN